MMGSFITRGLVMVLGYAYPAYECFKTVEKNRPEIEQLRFWCQYWILVAVLTVFERIGDNFVSWLPLYGEAKLAFFIYLWYPRTKGTTYIYETFFRPYVAKHEPEIDRNLLELRTRAGDVAVLYWQRAAGYGQTRFFEILQYVAAQSSSAPPPTKRQPQPSQPGPFQPVAPTSRQPPAKPQQNEPANSSASQQQPAPPAKEPPNQAAQATTSTNQQSKQQLPPPPSVHHPVQSQLQPPQRTLPIRSNSGTSEALDTKLPPITGNAEKTDAESTLSSDKDPNASVSEDVIMEDTIRMTRARLRRARKES